MDDLVEEIRCPEMEQENVIETESWTLIWLDLYTIPPSPCVQL